MSSAFRFTPLFIAFAATMPTVAHADEAAEGFVAGSSFNLHLRNAYFNRNNLNSGVRDNREWG